MTVAQADQRPRYTIEEYTRLEDVSDVKHEWHDGEILAMSGGSYEHSLITTNTIAALHARVQGKPCRALDSNMRIATPKRVFYPDSSIICGPPEFDARDRTRQSISNPKVIVEVLSPTTEAYDRGEKFRHYRQLPSLGEYVLITQTAAVVETFVRQPDDDWRISAFTGLDVAAQLRAVEIQIPLAEIYAGVTFPPETPPPTDAFVREFLP